MKGEFHRLCRPRIISLKRLKRKKKKRRGEEKHVYREGEKGEGIGWKKNASRGVKWHGGGGRRGETSLRSLHGLFFCFFGKEISLLRCDWKSLAPPPFPPSLRSFATNFHRRISSISTLIAFSRDKGRDYHIVHRLICSIIVTSRGFYYGEDFIKEN